MSFPKFLLLLLTVISLNVSAFDLFNLGIASDKAAFISANQTKSNKFNFNFPDIDLVDQHNQVISLEKIGNTQQNVVFAFFFTHCVTICTTTTLSLKSIQPDLPDNTLIAMISIDPQTDSPEVLQDFAEKHHINDPQWLLLTGDTKQIIDFQKSFNAYSGNKMNHSTSLYIKRPNSNLITELQSNFSTIPELLKQESAEL